MSTPENDWLRTAQENIRENLIAERIAREAQAALDRANGTERQQQDTRLIEAARRLQERAQEKERQREKPQDRGAPDNWLAQAQERIRQRQQEQSKEQGRGR